MYAERDRWEWQRWSVTIHQLRTEVRHRRPSRAGALAILLPYCCRRASRALASSMATSRSNPGRAVVNGRIMHQEGSRGVLCAAEIKHSKSPVETKHAPLARSQVWGQVVAQSNISASPRKGSCPARKITWVLPAVHDPSDFSRQGRSQAFGHVPPSLAAALPCRDLGSFPAWLRGANVPVAPP